MTLAAIQDKARIEPLTEVLVRRGELPDVQTFRIAAYNVYNLFGADPDVHSGRPNPPTPEDQLDALGEMIRNLDADAIAFEEVQNEKVLANLLRTTGQPEDPGQRLSLQQLRVRSGAGPPRHQRGSGDEARRQRLAHVSRS